MLKSVAAWSAPVRHAVTGAGMYAVPVGLDGLIHLALIPLVTRTVSVEEFAQFALVTIAVYLLLVVIDLGCGGAAIRQLALTESGPDQDCIVATLLSSRAVIGGSICLALIAVNLGMAPPIQAELNMGIGALFLWALFQAGHDLLQGQQRHAALALCKTIRVTMWGATVLCLVVLSKWGLMGLLSAYAITYGTGLAAVMVALGKRTIAARPDAALFRSMLRFGAPLSGYYLLRDCGALDRYLIRFRSSLSEAGLFQIASVPTAAIEMMEIVLTLPGTPYVWGASATERQDALGRFVRVGGFIVSSVAIPLSIFASELLTMLAPASYRVALGAVPWLTFAAAIRAITYFVGLGAGVVGKTRVLAITGACELALAGLGLLWVLPWGGLAAAGIVRMLAALVSLPLCYLLLRRLFPVRLVVGRLIVYLSLVTIICAALGTHSVDLFAPLWLRGLVAISLIGTGYLLLMPRSKAHSESQP